MHSRPVRGATASTPRLNRRDRILSRALTEALEPRRMLSVTNLIEGTSVDQAGGYPPDPNGAVSSSHVVNVANSRIQWFTRAGSKQGDESLQDFFNVGTTAALADPKIQFDQYNNVFIVEVMELKTPGDAGGDLVDESHILLAVSRSSDPNNGWFYQDVNTSLQIRNTSTGITEANFSNYPSLAYSSDSIFLTANMYPFSAIGSSQSVSQGGIAGVTATDFTGTRLWILPKSGLYGGGISPVRVFDPATQLGLPQDTNTLQPARTYGTTPDGVGTYLLATGTATGSGHEQLYVIKVDRPLADVSFTLRTIDVGDISDGSIHGAPQPWDLPVTSDGDTSPFDPKQNTIDDRIMNAVFREVNGVAYLFAANDIVPTLAADLPNAGQVTAHYYQLNVTNFDAPVIKDQGDIGGEDIGIGVNTYFPAIMPNAEGDIVVGFSASGPGAILNSDTGLPPDGYVPIYPGAYVTSHLATDPAGTVRGSLAVAAGQALYQDPNGQGSGFGSFFSDVPSVNLWGDYSGIALDPTDERSFWIYNSYSLGDPITAINGSALWGTRWGKVTPELLDEPAVGNFVWNDLNGNGLQDTDEPGLEGVVFRLYDSSNNLIQTVTSDKNGFWNLEGSPTGHAIAGSGYYIEEDISGVDATTGLHILQGFTFSPYQVDPSKTAIDSDFLPESPTSFRAYYRNLTLTSTSFIEDIDAGLFKPFINLLPPALNVQEGNAGTQTSASFTVTLSAKPAYPSGPVLTPVTSPWITTVYYSTIPLSATADVDFKLLNTQTLVIPAGQSSGAINVPVYGDNVPEGDEKFELIIGLSSDVLGTDPALDEGQIDKSTTTGLRLDTATAIISDPEDQPTISLLSGPTVVEGGATPTYALFTLSLSVPAPYDGLKVHVATVAGTATPGLDYDPAVIGVDANGDITFDKGQLTRTVRVRVLGDFVVEGNETFTLALSAPVNAVLGSASTATATILDLASSSITFGGTTLARFFDEARQLVTLRLSGPGTGSVTATTSGIGRQIVLDGTTEDSVLTIQTSHGQTTFSGIQVHGSLRAINGQTTNLMGALVATGIVRTINLNYLSGGSSSIGSGFSPSVLVSLNIRRVSDASITSETAIGMAKLGSWADSDGNDVLSAPFIQNIQAASEFQGRIQTADLGMLNVGSTLSKSVITATHAIGKISARSISGATISSATTIHSITVRGGVFSNSRIMAPVIGSLAFGEISNTTGALLVAATADRIGLATWRTGGHAFKASDLDVPGDRALGDNTVLRLT